MKKLEFLEIRTSRVKDITSLYDLPLLNHVDLRNLRLPAAQVETFKRTHPATEVFYP
jgi:hypothetical protein